VRACSMSIARLDEVGDVSNREVGAPAIREAIRRRTVGSSRLEFGLYFRHGELSRADVRDEDGDGRIDLPF